LLKDLSFIVFSNVDQFYLEKMIGTNDLLRALRSQTFNEVLGIFGVAS